MSSAKDDLISRTLAMKKWAVVGANNDPERFGYKLYRTLVDHGYDVVPVNPSLEEVQGTRCHASIADIPEPPEVVDMVVNPRVGIGVMKEIAQAGIRYVWLQPGTRSDEIRGFAREHEIELVEDCVMAQLAAQSGEDQTRRSWR